MEPATAGKLQIPNLALLCSEVSKPGCPIQMAFTPEVRPVGRALVLGLTVAPSHAPTVEVAVTFMCIALIKVGAAAVPR
jgi:hypothetical protein